MKREIEINNKLYYLEKELATLNNIIESYNQKIIDKDYKNYVERKANIEKEINELVTELKQRKDEYFV